MNIIKHGNSAKDVLNTEEFRCEQCGCEFSADYDEYYVEKGSCLTTSSSMSYVYSAVVTDIYICCCPECRKVVTKTKNRTVENPTITCGTQTSDPCESCSTNPKNGGSGNCNCTLGSKKITTC